MTPGISSTSASLTCSVRPQMPAAVVSIVVVGHRNRHAGDRDAVAVVVAVRARRAVGQRDRIVYRVRITARGNRHRLARFPVRPGESQAGRARGHLRARVAGHRDHDLRRRLAVQDHPVAVPGRVLLRHRQRRLRHRNPRRVGGDGGPALVVPGSARRPHAVSLGVGGPHPYLVGRVRRQVPDRGAAAGLVLRPVAKVPGVARAVLQVVAVYVRAPRVRRRRPAHLQARRGVRRRRHHRLIHHRRRLVLVRNVDGHGGS